MKLGINVMSVTISFTYHAVPPRFTIEPPSFVAYRQNENVSVMCTANGNPEPTVKWVRNGVDFWSGVSGNKSEKALVIISLSTSQQGNYTCIATNKFGYQSLTHVFIGNSIWVRWCQTGPPKKDNQSQRSCSFRLILYTLRSESAVLNWNKCYRDCCLKATLWLANLSWVAQLTPSECNRQERRKISVKTVILEVVKYWKVHHSERQFYIEKVKSNKRLKRYP